MSRTTARAALAAVAALMIAASGAAAQNRAARDGELDKSIDTESTDPAVKLRALEQELYVTQQYLYLMMFRQQYAGRIQIDRVLYANHDGGQTPAYVLTAADLDRTGRHPGLVVVHGGYHGSLDPNYFGLLEAAVRHGYVVIFPEYRGSRGYGAAHYDAVDFGGKEVDDVAAAADYLARFHPVDPQRIGIYGRSKGGMITLLAIQRFPDRFAAAVDVVGLTDMVAYMAYKPGFRGDDVARQPRFRGKSPSEDLVPYMDVSPLNHVDKIRTPLLIHSTTGDKTAPVQLHAGRLIDVLKARGKDFEYKIYDGAPGGHLYSYTDSEEARDSERLIFDFLARRLSPAAGRAAN